MQHRCVAPARLPDACNPASSCARCEKHFPPSDPKRCTPSLREGQPGEAFVKASQAKRSRRPTRRSVRIRPTRQSIHTRSTGADHVRRWLTVAFIGAVVSRKPGRPPASRAKESAAEGRHSQSSSTLPATSRFSHSPPTQDAAASSACDCRHAGCRLRRQRLRRLRQSIGRYGAHGLSEVLFGWDLLNQRSPHKHRSFSTKRQANQFQC